MTPAALLVVLVGLSLVAYVLGKSRALATVGGSRGIRNLHSLPSYYGALTALWCAVPALVVLGAWVAFQDTIIIQLVMSHMPAAVQALSESERGLVDQRRLQRRRRQCRPSRTRGPKCARPRRNIWSCAPISRLALTALVHRDRASSA